ncbi:MAG: hypothetical protein A2946_00560 [Candidatus Liptonbacteria bacterium RIFCSPLOWO2_01_FULL_53_13]|uniref:Uncharacterized protein n=1 Tax=Candidatus Liptonbacteria bacterium RIFCSPLOWO2_01_FULL_53_13 TaxID=1798651 RepID=A0A1G2CGG6_9BACT|nr:MAG: hypothetical protein A2946_00560 [Candidatus Liptonbacteria bacterium RIFCSPLOWO2_01_FULL_53_13]
MTILQPHKQIPLINYVLGALILAVFAGALSLVYSYNGLVDAEHRVAKLKSDAQDIETESALVRDKIFALMGSAQLESLAAEHALVKDKSPKYLTLDAQWSLASR